jgi:hypothetical protein
MLVAVALALVLAIVRAADSVLWNAEEVVKMAIQMGADDWQRLAEENTECFDTPDGKICHKPFECTHEVKTYAYTEYGANCTTQIGNRSTAAPCLVTKRSHCGSNSWKHPALSVKSANHDKQLFGGKVSFVFANAIQDVSFLRLPLGFWASCILGIPSPRYQFAEISVADGESMVYSNTYISLEDPAEESFRLNHFGTHEGAMWELDGDGDLWEGGGGLLNGKHNISGTVVGAQPLYVDRAFTTALSPYNTTSCSYTVCNKPTSFLDPLGLVDTECDYAKGVGTTACVDPTLSTTALQSIARWVDLDRLLDMFVLQLILGECDGIMTRNNAYMFFVPGVGDSPAAFQFVPWVRVFVLLVCFCVSSSCSVLVLGPGPNFHSEGRPRGCYM